MDTSNQSIELRNPELDKEATEVLAFADQFQIVNSDEEYEMVGEAAKRLKGMSKKADEFFDPLIKNAFKTHRDLTAAKKKITEPLERRSRMLSQSIVDFNSRREAERRKAEEEANKLAETEGIENPPVIVQETVPKVQGISTRDNWSAVVVDLNELIKAIAKGKVPLMAINQNQTFLNQQARSLKDQLDYPGVKAVNNPTAAVRV